MKPDKISKRDFLKYTATALAGTAFTPVITKASAAESYSARPEKPILRKLGKTDIEIPVVSSGIIPVDNLNLVRAIFRSGIKHIDSAWEYSNGRNDEVIGQMFREFNRDNYIISNKILLPSDPDTGQYVKDATTKAFMDQLELSLKRLGTDHVDILYLHKPANRAAALNEEMLNGMRLAKEQGKARYVGLSTHSNQVEMLDAVRESGLYETALVGYNYRQSEEVKKAIKKAADAGIGIVAMKMFAGGWLDKEKTKPVNKRAALKWVLNDENITTAAVTFWTYDILEEIMPLISDIQLTKDEERELEETKLMTGLYCTGCEKCLAQCPEKLPVPDMMRAYMYAYGYGKAAMAKSTLHSIRIPDSPCNNCSTCSVKCTAGFDIKEKISDITRLRNVPEEFLT